MSFEEMWQDSRNSPPKLGGEFQANLQEEQNEAFASRTCSRADARTAVRGAATAGVLRNTHSSTSCAAMLQLPYRREDGRAAAGLQRERFERRDSRARCRAR